MKSISTLALFIVSLARAVCISQAACSSCLVSSVIGATKTSIASNHHQKMCHHHPAVAQNTRSALTFLAFNRLSTHFGNLLRAEAEVDKDDQEQGREELFDELMKAPDSKANKKSAASKPVTAGMVGAIGFYKNFISPLLPPACRFLPTCSQYGVQAIEEYGPEKGLVLTAWRLLRCSPFGGRGYDPPKWPPVVYTYGSY